VKVLLDSKAIGLFTDITFTKNKRFRIERLKNSLLIRNMERTVDVGGAITYQVEYNMFFKGHIKRARIDVYNVDKIKMILGMP